jgi:TRAP-type C4-dicarboxylate transport system permease small subunit
MAVPPPAEPHHDPDIAGGGIGRATALIRRVNRWLHYIGGITLVALMMITVVDVVGRSFFDRPFRGTVELTEMAMIVIIYLAFGYAEHEGDHISVDLVHRQLRRVPQLVLTVFNGAFGVAVIGLMTWHLYQFAGRLQTGGYTTAVLKIPQGPVALISVAGAAMFVLALATTAVLALRALVKARS